MSPKHTRQPTSPPAYITLSHGTASRCLQTRPWRQPVPECSSCRGFSPHWARTTRCTLNFGGSQKGTIESTGTASVRAHPVDAIVRRQGTEASGTSQGDCGESQGHFGFRNCRPRTAGSTSGGRGTEIWRIESRREGGPFTVPSPFKVDPPHIAPEEEEFKRLQETIVGLQQELAKLRGRRSNPPLWTKTTTMSCLDLQHKKTKVEPSTPLAITSGHAQLLGTPTR